VIPGWTFLRFVGAMFVLFKWNIDIRQGRHGSYGKDSASVKQIRGVFKWL
jgi:hypothetical protein